MRDGKHVILYVDDDRDILDAMRVRLESRGYVMVEATSAEEGLRAYRREKPDLVLVDLMMEEVDSGVRLVRELRHESHRAPAVMVTSVGDSFAMTADTAQLGLAGILQKPVEPAALDPLLRAKLR